MEQRETEFVQTASRGQRIVQYCPRNRLLRPCDCLLEPDDGPRRPADATERAPRRASSVDGSVDDVQPSAPSGSGIGHDEPPHRTRCTQRPIHGVRRICITGHRPAPADHAAVRSTSDRADTSPNRPRRPTVRTARPRASSAVPRAWTHRSRASDAMIHRSDRSVQTTRHPQPAHRTARHRR